MAQSAGADPTGKCALAFEHDSLQVNARPGVWVGQPQGDAEQMFGGQQHGKAVPIQPEKALEIMQSEDDFKTTPPNGSWISVRITQVERSDGRPNCPIDGIRWAIARDDE
ncbi:hypothetical protein [Rhodococcus opacus]|uniref:hypothetical protein n=1 Tax=Rhodococcus opacus TaxID=37919 RepID=UPI0010DC7325|nr:hypothetical protein [Rhodococcus opacus]MDV7088626.1 hypothetical protein [Rhodococcus opacus]RYE42319.1 MAG: hypothetical protein EOP24_33150 [Hyphomicrobiales bacterium]